MNAIAAVLHVDIDDDDDDDGSVSVSRVVGVLNRRSASVVRSALLKRFVAQPDLLAIDISEMSVDDEIAVSVFPTLAQAAAEWPGCAVVLCAPRPEVAAVLDRFGISSLVAIHPTVDGAVAALATSPAPRRLRERLTPVPGSAARARGLVSGACQAWGLRALSDVAQLIVTELVTNAIRHAGTEIDVTVSFRRRFLYISVRDCCEAPPRRCLGGESPVGGRGLLVVEALSAAWGSTSAAGGKVVWATLGDAVPEARF